MVKETRQVFDLSDIKAIRFQCGHCKREVVQPLDTAEVTKKCPICKEEWEANLPGEARGPNYALIRYMKELVRIDSPKMTVRFEIEGDEESSK